MGVWNAIDFRTFCWRCCTCEGDFGVDVEDARGGGGGGGGNDLIKLLLWLTGVVVNLPLRRTTTVDDDDCFLTNLLFAFLSKKFFGTINVDFVFGVIVVLIGMLLLGTVDLFLVDTTDGVRFIFGFVPVLLLLLMLLLLLLLILLDAKTSDFWLDFVTWFKLLLRLNNGVNFVSVGVGVFLLLCIDDCELTLSLRDTDLGKKNSTFKNLL